MSIPHYRSILIFFDNYIKYQLLDNIWSVNIKGFNLQIAHAFFILAQLKHY